MLGLAADRDSFPLHFKWMARFMKLNRHWVCFSKAESTPPCSFFFCVSRIRSSCFSPWSLCATQWCRSRDLKLKRETREPQTVREVTRPEPLPPRTLAPSVGDRRFAEPRSPWFWRKRRFGHPEAMEQDGQFTGHGHIRLALSPLLGSLHPPPFERTAPFRPGQQDMGRFDEQPAPQLVPLLY